MRDEFSTYHPIVNMVFFVGAIGIGMFMMHPIFLALSFAAAISYQFMQTGTRGWKTVVWMLPFFVLAAGMNALFTHQGMTLLFYLNNGNPVTLEAILYGLAAGTMLVGVLLWFTCFNRVITSDKLTYLFGKLVPALSLLLSMIFRMIPKLQKQLKQVSMAQKGIGRDSSEGNLWLRIRNGMKMLSIITTWSFESSVQTADSMRARGYGLRGRTNYVKYRMTGRDRRALLFCIVTLGIVFWGKASGTITFYYYPAISWNQTTPAAIAVYVAFGLFLFLPIICNIWEDARWKYIRSKI